MDYRNHSTTVMEKARRWQHSPSQIFKRIKSIRCAIFHFFLQDTIGIFVRNKFSNPDQQLSSRGAIWLWNWVDNRRVLKKNDFYRIRFSCDRMFRLLAHPLSPPNVRKFSLFLSSSCPVCRWSDLLDGRRWGGGTRGANSYDREKARSL